MPELYNVAIVGAGPIGIELHAALEEAGYHVFHADAGPIGHTMRWWAPGTTFFSSPERIAICGSSRTTAAQGKLTGEAYIRSLVDVVRGRGLIIHPFRAVTAIRRDESFFELDTQRSREGLGGEGTESLTTYGPIDTVRAHAVVLTIGNMHRARRLGIPGEDLPHVSHYLDDPLRHVGRSVLVVGGKNSAVEAAIRLHRVGAGVTLSYRNPEFDAERVKPWLLPELKWLIDKGRIRFLPETVPMRIDADRVTLHGPKGETELRPDAVRLLTGYGQDQTLFDQLGVERLGDIRRPAYDHDTMETSVPGVYVAGTACGGSQTRARVFIENSHIHVDRICRALTGQGVPWALDQDFAGLGGADEER
ncbi:MAG: NAD(P)-binding domain-containing protein [Planctomycetota bacterium]